MGMMVSLLLSALLSAFPPPVVAEGGVDMSSGMDGATDEAETGYHPDRDALLLPRGMESLASGIVCRDRANLISVPEWLDSFLDRAPSLGVSGISFQIDRRSFLLGYTLDLSI